MSRLHTVALLALVLGLGRASHAAPPTAVHYTVHVADVAQKRFHVDVELVGVTDAEVVVALPKWTPGWYVITEAERHLKEFSAIGEGRALDVEPASPSSWRITTGGAKTLTLSYDLDAPDDGLGFFLPYLDPEHGFVPGPASLVYVVGGKNVPSTVHYDVPAGWQVASANDPVAGEPRTFSAPDYDTLIDQPADLGLFRRVDRTIQGTPVSLILVGAEGASTRRWTDGVFKLADAAIKYFGGAPFPRYLFHFHFADAPGGFYGGLEHKNATAIRLGPETLTSNSLSDFALTAHEFVHAWNVKRARPAVLGPFDYTQRVRVKELWFCEGVTEYLAPRIVVEAGLAGREFWLGYMAQNLTTLATNPARKRVTLEQSSLKVWEGPDESQGFGGLSYYNKGMIVGLLLDIEMRQRSGNKCGVRELLLELVQQAEKTGRGYGDGELEKTASRLCGSDLSAFFQKVLRTTDELPLEETLAKGGIAFEERVSTVPTLGIVWDLAGSGAGQARIDSVVAGGPAAQIGLQTGDIVTAYENKSIDALTGPAFERRKPGETIRLTVVRDDRPFIATLTLGSREDHAIRLRPIANPTAEQTAILRLLCGDR